MKKIRILLVDPHEIVREGFKSLLRTQADMHVVGETASANSALLLAESTKPEVVLLDMTAPGFAGPTWLMHLRGHSPKTKVLCFAMREDKDLEQELLAAGAAGFLLKQVAFAELVNAIRQVARHELDQLPNPSLTSTPFPTTPLPEDTPLLPSGLTPPEEDVARLVGQGFSNKEICAKLGMTKEKVASLKHSSMHKLNLRSRIDFVRYAQAQGWLKNL